MNNSSDDCDLRPMTLGPQHPLRCRLLADVNQLTIAGTVEREPERQHDHHGEPICTFVLTHIIDRPCCRHSEQQYYHVSITAPLSQAFAATYRPGQKVIVTGRLDSPAIDPHGLVPGRAWIIAHDISVIDP